MGKPEAIFHIRDALASKLATFRLADDAKQCVLAALRSLTIDTPRELDALYETF